MKFLCILLLISLSLSFTCAQEAKKAVVKNDTDIFLLTRGDRVTGTLQEFKNNKIVITSNTLGETSIPWKEVVGIESSRYLYFLLKGGNTIQAKAEGLSGEKQVLNSPLAGKIAVGRDQILAVGTTEENVNPTFVGIKKELADTKEKLRKATEVGEVWSGYLNINFSGTNGNKDSVTFNGIAHVERTTEFDKFTAHLDTKYGETENELNSHSVNGYLRENLNLTKDFYVYGRMEGEWDKVKEINLGLIVELGLGWHILKKGDFKMFEGDEITLDFDLGASYTSIDYDEGDDTQSAGMVARFLYDQVFSNKWSLHLLGEYIQDFEKPENKNNASSFDGYRVRGEIRLEIPITKVLSFTGSIRDEYNNAPATGNERNDFYWLFGLKLAL